MDIHRKYLLKPEDNVDLYLDNSFRLYDNTSKPIFDELSVEQMEEFMVKTTLREVTPIYEDFMSKIISGGEVSEQDLTDLLRALHTIKGLLNGLGGFGVANAIHLLESLLETVTAEEFAGRDDISEIMEDIWDEIAKYIGALDDGDPDPTDESLLLTIVGIIEGKVIYGEVPKNNDKTEAQSELYSIIQNIEKNRNPIYYDSAAVGALQPLIRGVLNRVKGSMIYLPIMNIYSVLRKGGPVSIKNLKFVSDLELDVINGADPDEYLSRINTIVLVEGEIEDKKTEGKGAKEKSTLKSRKSNRMEVDLEILNSLTNNIEGMVLWRNRVMKFSEKLNDIDSSSSLRAEYLEIATNVDILTNQLQLTSENLRVLGIRTIFTELDTTARGIAREYGKKIRVSINSNDVKIDKASLSMVKESLGHIIRNCVCHGIEDKDTRISSGKQTRGSISLSAFYGEKEILISVSDDGAGIPIGILKRKAVESGIMNEQESGDMSDDEAIQLIFHKGLSSADVVDSNAGRGVGMDSVGDMISGIGGKISVRTRSGLGTTFTISLPLTISIIKAVKVVLQGQVLAVPISSISNVGEIDRATIERAGVNNMVVVGDTAYQVVRPNKIFPFPGCDNDEESGQFVVIEHLGKKVILFIGSLLGKEELIIKNLAVSIPGFTGAAISGDGNPILIANPEYIVSETMGI